MKNPGKSSRVKGNGPQDMEIDHVGTVPSGLSSKACQTKAECQVKSFDGLGPFSYVCRMMRFSEPNTNEFEPEGGSVYERCVGDQH